MKSFIRSILRNGHVECSWYDKNGRRYKHTTTSFGFENRSVVESDNKYGYMAYAKLHNFKIIDNWLGEHPKRLKG